MSARVSSGSLPDRLLRWWAAVCAGLVLLLTLSAVSPSLHGLFHATDSAPAAENDDCAVELFAVSAACPVANLTLAPATVVVADQVGTAGPELFLVRPRYLRQPERGPPSGWTS